jgi:virginiamycin B lyase
MIQRRFHPTFKKRSPGSALGLAKATFTPKTTSGGRLRLERTILPRRRATVLASFAAVVVLPLVVAATSPAAVGDITTFTGSGHHPSGDIATGPDGNLWFTGGNEIGRITPEGSYTFFTLGVNLGGITAGSDGNLWFTEPDAGDVGRITPTGAITEFELTNTSTSMFDIASGPDGNLWLAEGDRQMIGRLPTTGSGLTEFGPVTGSRPYSITKGPDGNLWFAEFGGQMIGRITTGGGITEFSSGTRLPFDIAGGPDGNIWFTLFPNNDTGRIARVGPDGSGLTEFSAGLTGTEVDTIAAGPDGNLWFTERGPAVAPKVGRITPTGAITEFSLPSFADPSGITAGPDGNMWVVTSQGIARVITGETPPSTPILTVSVGGNGSGTVTGSGIDCPGMCSANYPTGTQVTLTPTPAEGSTFAGWSGACSGTGACSPTVNGPTAVTAEFASPKVEQGAKIGKKKGKVRNGTFKVSWINVNGVIVDAKVVFTGTIDEADASKKNVKLAGKEFSIPADGTAAVKLKLAKKGVAYLKTHKSLKTKAKITLSANGTSRTTTEKFTLIAPKK